MKQIKHFLGTIFPGRRLLSFTLMTLLITSLSSCFQQYYKTNTTSKTDSATIGKLQNANKVFIVHTPEEAFLLNNVKLDSDVLSGDKNSLSQKYTKYLNPLKSEANRYPKREKQIALSEVHLYTNSSFNGNGPVSLATSQIFRMDVYDKDLSATRRSRVMSIVGITAPIVGVVVIGAIAASELNSEQFTLNFH